MMVRHPRSRRPALRQYWRFYWPLALTGVAMVLAMQAQNGALARYPGAVTELAVFALASSTFGLFNAGLNFTAQLSNVFARSRRGRLLSHRFVRLWSLALTVPLAVLAITDAGHAAVAATYGIDAALANRVLEYIAYMLPLLFISAERFYYTGLLVQSQLTGWVTALNVVFLSVAIAALVVGFAWGIAPVHTLVGAQALAGVLHWVLSAAVAKYRYRWPATREHEDLTMSELIRFFLPMTATGVMFAISRPVLYAFVSRVPDGIATIAALRVAFDFTSMFQQAANQFRHFFVTFGLGDLAAKRRFMALICAGITLLMLAVALTPLANWLLGGVLGIRGEVLSNAVDVILVLCLMPLAIVIRNYYHGHLMVKRRTTGMAIGGTVRVVAMAALAQIAYAVGALNHIVAAFILLTGFATEAAMVLVSAKRIHASGPSGAHSAR